MSALENMRDWLEHLRDCDECRRGERDPHCTDPKRCADGAEICIDYVAQVEREQRRPNQ